LKKHTYRVAVRWTGADGTGTRSYTSYRRAYEISAPGKPAIEGSSDPAFRGDAARWNPEELLVASLAACHELWYLHLCAQAHVVVLAYADDAEGTMIEGDDGGGRFESVTLRPDVIIASDSSVEQALAAHESAHAKCFIANSVSFPVRCEPKVRLADAR